ncbi:MAG: 3-deoxy-D-manno-octulosonic acid transferase [Hyphomicrobiales bacterium]
MRILGDLALKTYWLAMQAARPLLPVLIEKRKKVGKEDRVRHQERLGDASLARPQGPLIWIHAASVGETNAVLPICTSLALRGFHILVTTVTTTAAQTVAEKTADTPNIFHQYAPLDVPSILRKFIDHWQPNMAIFAESEIWPVTIKLLSERTIPFAIVNGRMSDRSFRRWRTFRAATPSLFEHIDQVLVRGEEDLLRFRELGARKVTISGNLKYDSPIPKIDATEVSAFKKDILNRPLFLATSTHDGEEQIALKTHQMLRERFPNLLTCIAPRHPRRGPEVAQMADDFELQSELRSKVGNPSSECQVYIADTLGELGLFYALAPAALIGGSLVPVGGHNPIEAAQLGCAVLSGPNVSNFREVFGVLEGANGCLIVKDQQELANALTRCLEDTLFAKGLATNANKALEGVGGAVERSLAALEPLLAVAASGKAELVKYPRNSAA